MPDVIVIFGFVAASLIVLLTPGPGVAYVTARSLAQGRAAGLISALGLSAGAFVHVIAAAVGLSSILLASATAFTAVKIVGAAYLVFLGLRIVFARAVDSIELIESPPAPARRLFTDGVMISVLNPKIAVFFLAFLPQFIDPAVGSPTVQILCLGLLYCTLSVITDGGYALLAAQIRDWIAPWTSRSRMPRYLSGGVFIGLGIQAAFAERPR